MSLLIKSVTIIDPNSPHNGSKRDIFINRGKIEKIADSIEKENAKETIEQEGLIISPSWVDIGTYSGEPGNEHRETFESLQRAALYGGYGHVVISPDTHPAIDNSSMVRSILAQQRKYGVKIWPLAALSTALNGKDLTELLDLADAGAIGFSNGEHAITSNSFMMKALEYVKKLDQAVFHQPHDFNIVPAAQVHESKLSMQLGLKAWPSISETILMDRDIELLKYTESRLSWHNITSSASLERVKWAKDQGLRVNAGVGYLHLCYDQSVLESFDSQFKLSPPLRSKNDKDALWKAINSGIVDYIVSEHKPWEEERKKLEFPFAAFGAEGLETAFQTFLEHCPFDDAVDIWVQKTAIGPREILGMAQVKVREGEKADFTLFNKDDEYKFQIDNIQSISKNNPNIGKLQKGRIQGRISEGSYFPCEYVV